VTTIIESREAADAHASALVSAWSGRPGSLNALIDRVGGAPAEKKRSA